jgi:hypothetical protein
MRSRELDAALAAANPLGGERAAALPLGSDRRALLEAIAGEPLAAPARRRHDRRALVPLVALLAALAAAGLFTMPGRAVSGWVGDRLGLGGPGEPGGPPALRQLNEKWSGAMELPVGRQRVLLVGPVTGQHRSRWEFITFRPPRRAHGPSYGQGACFKLDLTQVRGMISEGCGILPKGGAFVLNGVGGGHNEPYRDSSGAIHFRDELTTFAGRVGPAVASVAATLDGREIPVQVRPVPDELRRRFHLDRPFSFFLGFITDAPYGGTLEVTARGADGAVLGHSKIELGNQVLSSKMSCRFLRKQHQHLPPAGAEQCRLLLGRNGR